MTHFEQHQKHENKNRLNSAFPHLTPRQQLTLLLRAYWWSLPTLHQLIHRHRNYIHKHITYLLYPAHWLGT